MTKDSKKWEIISDSINLILGHFYESLKNSETQVKVKWYQWHFKRFKKSAELKFEKKIIRLDIIWKIKTIKS